jgi:[acyl-carrier-protein] S-malonyltransferase
MQEAVPVGEGAMAEILMLDLPQIEEACREAAQGQVVAPANMNTSAQVVIAGHKAAVERAMEKCTAAGAKRVVPLPVSAPFHCSLMKPAQDRLEPELRAAAFKDPRVPLVNNADARIVKEAAECCDGLVRQVSSPVRWQESVERLVAEGVTTFVEVGAGDVLAGMIKRIAPKGTPILGVQDPESLEKTVAALSAVKA